MKKWHVNLLGKLFVHVGHSLVCFNQIFSFNVFVSLSYSVIRQDVL